MRELENVIERATILSPGPDLLLPEGAVPATSLRAEAGRDGAPTPATGAPSGTLEEVERAHIRAVLQRTAWRIEGDQGAARILALHPNTLRSRMKKLGIRRTATASEA